MDVLILGVNGFIGSHLTEAIFATGVLPPGVYCVAHGRALAFPGVVKDREGGRFVKLG